MHDNNHGHGVYNDMTVTENTGKMLDWLKLRNLIIPFIFSSCRTLTEADWLTASLNDLKAIKSLCNSQYFVAFKNLSKFDDVRKLALKLIGDPKLYKTKCINCENIIAIPIFDMRKLS